MNSGLDERQLGGQLDGLSALSLDQLRDRWRSRFKRMAPAHQSKDLLIRAYAYELQARAGLGLKRSLRTKLDELAKRFGEDRNHRPSPAAGLKPGSVLIRDWNGRRYAVTVTEGGFLLDGKAFASLTAVAGAITGIKWSGPRFFRLTETPEGKSP